MWKRMLVLVLALAALCPVARAARIIPVTTHDGYVLEGKLDMPEGPVERLVVFVNGSGPNTYDNTRGSGEDTFNYYDLFARELTARGVAFFRASARGCAPGGEPPMYVDIDEAVYQTYVPENSIRDVEAMVTALKGEEGLKDAPVWLLGWSEGTMIASHVSSRGIVSIDGLALCGYVNGTMFEALQWQQTGGSSMVFYRQYFDSDSDGAITQAEYEADPSGLLPYLGGAAFSDLDLDGDGVLAQADFARMLEGGWAELRQAIERGDDEYLRTNYPVRLTSAWFAGHAALAPNREILPTLDLPIHILHGDCDGNATVQGVYDIRQAFEALGKDNLSVHIYPDHDHDLNFTQYLVEGTLSPAFAELFDILGGADA